MKAENKKRSAAQLADILVPMRILIIKGICTYDELNNERSAAIDVFIPMFKWLGEPGSDDVASIVDKTIEHYLKTGRKLTTP